MNYWTSAGSSSSSRKRNKKMKNDGDNDSNKKQKNQQKEKQENQQKLVLVGDAVVDDHPNSLICRFCTQRPAAVYVDLPIIGRLTKRQATPYCLRCYYTTSAVRHDSTKFVRVLDQQQVDDQLPTIQDMFSEAFLELQQEISHEAELAFQRRKKSSDDPLASLMMMGGINKNNNKSNKRRISSSARADAGATTTKQHTARVGRAGKADDGGFLRDAQIPERFVRTQQHQRQLQQQRLERLNRASSAPASAAVDDRSTTQQQLSKRRKGSRKSIWNLAMEQQQPTTTTTMTIRKKPPPPSMNNDHGHDHGHHGVVCSSCSSSDVHSFGNITSRNADVRKGEIWGSGSRSDNDVIHRYQCNSCGKMWNEEE